MFTFGSHAPYGRCHAEPVGRISCNLYFDCKYVRYVTCMSRVTLHYTTLKISTTAAEFYFRRSCFVLAHVQMLCYYTYLLTATSISVAPSGIAPQKYTQLHDSFMLVALGSISLHYITLENKHRCNWNLLPTLKFRMNAAILYHRSFH